MRLLNRLSLKQLAWPWSASALTALVGLLMHWYDDEVFVVVYGYTPLFAIPFILCLMHLWPRGPWLTSLLMFSACFAAQWCFIQAHTKPFLVLMDGSLSAIIAAFISTRIGHRLKMNVPKYVVLFICGACAMLPLIAFGPRIEVSVIASVCCWQLTVGTILVAAAGLAPATRKFNMGVLQT
jgi:hypothetical protein